MIHWLAIKNYWLLPTDEKVMLVIPLQYRSKIICYINGDVGLYQMLLIDTSRKMIR